jgi:putative peptidoglycan lipid II flippase
MASDIGIVANTLALALLLHQRRLIRVNELNWGEIAKAGVTSLVAGLLAYQVGRVLLVNNSRVADLKAIGLITITWAGTVAAGLWITRSSLVRDLRRRKATSYPRVAENQAEDLTKGIEP